MKNSLLILIVSTIIFSCGPKPHQKSEQIYNEQLLKFKKTISKKTTDTLITTALDSVFKKRIARIQDSIAKTTSVALTNGVVTQWIGTVNFNLRKPNFIIIHHTAQDSVAQTVKTFTISKTQVSAHYIVAKDGKVIHMLNDYLRAWHAGVASWGRNTDINSASIGIELDNNGKENFSEMQIKSLLALLSKLKKEYGIPAENIIGHADIAPDRKQDPSAFFPWKTLAENGFGIWYNEPLLPTPAHFDAEQALRIIGYNTKNLTAAIAAFKLHFMPAETNAVLDEKTINIIYNVFLKF
jgi:N-acetylmuramoyl-L-alanine amidase